MSKTWIDYFNEGVAAAINETADGPEKQAFLGTLAGAVGGGMLAKNFLAEAAKHIAAHKHPILSRIPIVKGFVRRGVQKAIKAPALIGGAALGGVAGKSLIDDNDKQGAEVPHPDHRFTSARGTVLTELAERAAARGAPQVRNVISEADAPPRPSLADLLPPSAPETPPKQAGMRLPTNAAPQPRQFLTPSSKMRPWKPTNVTMGSMKPKTAMDPITLATLAALAFGGYHGGRAAAKGRVGARPGLHQPLERFQHGRAVQKAQRKGGLVGAALGTGLGGYHMGKQDAQQGY